MSKFRYFIKISSFSELVIKLYFQAEIKEYEKVFYLSY